MSKKRKKIIPAWSAVNSKPIEHWRKPVYFNSAEEFKFWTDQRKKYNHKADNSRKMLREFSITHLNNPTCAERHFMAILHSLRLKYLEQPVCYKLRIIPDFVLESPYFLVIEIDGEYHQTAQQFGKDCLRDRKVAEFGYRTVRFTNEDVIENPTIVKNKLINVLAQQKALNRSCKAVRIFKGGALSAIKPTKPIKATQDSSTLAENPRLC